MRFVAIVILLRNITVVSVLYFLSISVLQAQSIEGFRDMKSLVIGHQKEAFPFAYLSKKEGKPKGFSLDVCHSVIDRLSSMLDQKISISYYPVVSNTRIPALIDGSIDLECGVTTNSLERQKLVSFSNSIFVARQRVAVKASMKVEKLEELSDETIVVIRGATGEPLGLDLVKKQPKLKLIIGEDLGDAYQKFINGEADAIIADDVILSSMFATEKVPTNYRFVEGALSVEPIAIMMRKDDPLKKLVDASLNELYQSGYIYDIYDKWFLSNLPDRDVNLGFPLSSEMRSIFENPNDRGVM